MVHPNSKAAYDQIKLTKTELDRRTIIQVLLDNPQGLTMHQVASIMGVALHTISGRFGELFNKARIGKDGIKKIHVFNQALDKNFTYERTIYKHPTHLSQAA